MAERYTLTDDIIGTHLERMLNLRKFYPFFAICSQGFRKYPDPAFRHLDVAYITLAVLRFFIHENSFQDKPVSYTRYADFCGELLQRDFGVRAGGKYTADSVDQVIRYIFDRIRNDGKAFSFTFYDPADHQEKTARVRLIESVVREDGVFYEITEDGIEFYLSTKEVRDESRITTEQLLLEKMIRAENFQGGIQVVSEINAEVQKLRRKKTEAIKLLTRDVKKGAEAVDAFMESTSQWFSDEQKSFQKTRALADKALSRLQKSGNLKGLKEVTALEAALKQTIENHGALIREAADLSRFSDEMIRRSRIQSLRPVFDFQNFLQDAIRRDSPADLEEILLPFLLPRTRKSFSASVLDNAAADRQTEPEEETAADRAPADLNFRYPDEILHDRTGKNYGRLFAELLGRVQRWDRFTLQEYNAILEIRFGKEIYRNRDYYGFLTSLAGQDHYSLREMEASPRTFLEEMVVAHLSPEEKEQYRDTAFRIHFGTEEIRLPALPDTEDGEKSGEESGADFAVTEMTFERSRD